ncbi:MAG: hypothetical protein ACI9TP_002187 [Candidatus Azotimanducaceae bacterium]|jgi:hypothetical protein
MLSNSTMPLTAEAHAATLADYTVRGVERGRQLDNRGLLRRDESGNLHPDILAAYWDKGFYIFEGLVDADEIQLLRDDMQYLFDHAPTGRGAVHDAQGRPAFGQQFKRNPYTFVKPLSDPWGGTDLLGGRHPVAMTQPAPADKDTKEVIFIMQGMCQIMDSGLRLYGHPDLLSIAQAVNGDDFVPYNDAIFVKPAGLGGAVAWHQDGVTHWNASNWDMGIHGFNFQVQLYACTPANCLWVVPGTHKLGKLDIKAMVQANGSEYLPDAIPLTCEPGDVTIVNRQLLHGSFANTSPNLRVSLTFGFHRRQAVLGARGALSQAAGEVYDEQRIFARACVIPVAIDARSQFYPSQSPFNYQPFAGLTDQYGYNDDTKASVIQDYNLKDLSI